MTITDPPHWVEQGKFKGDKYDKILEMIAELNTPTVPGPPADHASEHQDGGGDEIDVGGLSGLLADDQTPLSHDNTKHSTNYMPEAASGDRILIHQLPLGPQWTSIVVTAVGWTLYGNLFGMGKDNNWHTALNLPSVTGWTIKYTFACRVGYAAANTIYVRLHNRPHDSDVTGSQITINTGQFSGSFGLRCYGESGYITTGGSDLDIIANDGYQFQAYNSAAAKSVGIYMWNLNIYLVKD